MDGQGYFGGSAYIQTPNKSKRRLVLIVGGLAVVILVAVLGILSAGSRNSAENFSKTYLSNIAKQDTDKAYGMFDEALAANRSKQTFEETIEGYSKVAEKATLVSEKSIEEGRTQFLYEAEFGGAMYDLTVDVLDGESGKTISGYSVTQRANTVKETIQAQDGLEETSQ